MSRISHCHTLLTPFGFHCGDVKDKVGVLDARSGRFRRSTYHAVLSERIANSTNFQVFFRNLDFAAHRVSFASVLAIRMRITRLEEDLVLLAFPAQVSESHYHDLIRHRCNYYLLNRIRFSVFLTLNALLQYVTASGRTVSCLKDKKIRSFHQ